MTVPLGRAGRRATRITARAGGKTHRFRGPRRTVKLTIPYRGAKRSRLVVRIRTRDGRLKTIARTVPHCRGLS